MKKLAFIGNSEPPEKLLEIFRKFTPGNSGVWKNLQGVDNYKDADYFAVIDYLPPSVQVDESKCIFLGAHPETMQAYRNMDSYKGLKMYDARKTFGFGEWWIKYDYDYLSKLQPPAKTKNLACIVSDANTQPYHKKRRDFLERFCDKHGDKIDVYGRITPWGSIKNSYKGACGSLDPRGAAATGGNDHMSGKESVYEQYKYVIEFDATGKYYFSERVFDSLLLWAMPFYWGGENLHDFIPYDSFRYLNIDGDGQDVLLFLSDPLLYEKSLPDIAQARNVLLNRYHIWARTHEAIFGES